EEEVEDDAPLERGHFLPAASRDLRERFGRVQDGDDLVPGKVFEPEEVLTAPAGCAGTQLGCMRVGAHDGCPPGSVGGAGAVAARPSMATISSSGSAGRRWTRTRSTRSVLNSSPTTSARMGSSRWPRSTRTASRTDAGRPRSQTALRAARTVRPV